MSEAVTVTLAGVRARLQGGRLTWRRHEVYAGTSEIIVSAGDGTPYRIEHATLVAAVEAAHADRLAQLKKEA